MFVIILWISASWDVAAQELPATLPEKKKISPSSEVWLGAYTKYRIGEKLFYYGEYHLRRRDGFSEMGQLYLRFGLSYLASKYFEFTAGVVNPWYWAPQQNAPNTDKVVPQFRGWQQFLFVMPFERLKLYHQIRTEQRFKRDYKKDSPFKLTHRFRYKLTMYYPLNKPHLESQTVFLSAYEEIFIQAGKSIIYDHLEDNRVFIGLGYIFDDNWQVQTGYQWTFRHDNSPYAYQSRHIFRMSVYHNIDFYQER